MNMTEAEGLPAEGLAVVVLEWEGRKPPSSFYRHMRRLLHVWTRYGDLDRSDRGVWIQESAFVMADEALARLLAALAEEKGCQRLLVILEGRIVALSEQDRRAIRFLLRRWEKPGPRPYRTKKEAEEAYRQDVAEALDMLLSQADETVRRIL